jgi:hypothetical protein
MSLVIVNERYFKKPPKVVKESLGNPQGIPDESLGNHQETLLIFQGMLRTSRGHLENLWKSSARHRGSLQELLQTIFGNVSSTTCASFSC